MAHTIVGTRGAGRIERVDLRGDGALAVLRARREANHALAVVVAAPGEVIAHAVGNVAGELHDGNPVLQLRVVDSLVCLCDLVDEGIRGSLQGGNLRSSVTHLLLHRTRGIKDEDDVERRGRRRRQV